MKNTIVAAIGWVCTDVDCPTVAVNIAYLVWLATDGDKGDNRFGRDPKANA